MTKNLLFLFPALLTLAPLQAQDQLQPNDVIQVIGAYKLMYKHVLAYIDLEMEGEDLALLNDQEYMTGLTTECLEAFAAAPAEFIREMGQHYQAILLGFGNIQATQERAISPTRTQDPDSPTPPSSLDNLSDPNHPGGWKKSLSGGVLYYTAMQSSGNMMVQSTQYMHLCPDGKAYIYQSGGGSGEASGISVTDIDRMHFEGVVNWDILERGNQVFFRFSQGGATQQLPMRVVNQQLVIEGLGNFYFLPAAAVCR